MDSKDNQEKEYVLYQEAYDSILCEMCGTGYQSNALQALRMCERYDDLEPVVHAHWEHLSYDQDEDYDLIETAKCSNCGRHEIFSCGESPNYCPECGAKMDEVVVEE